MSDQPVRVFIADDHPGHREGVARAISARPGLELVGVAEDGRAALACIRDLQPDVAVVDGPTGVEVDFVREGNRITLVYYRVERDQGRETADRLHGRLRALLDLDLPDPTR